MKINYGPFCQRCNASTIRSTHPLYDHVLREHFRAKKLLRPQGLLTRDLGVVVYDYAKWYLLHAFVHISFSSNSSLPRGHSLALSYGCLDFALWDRHLRDSLEHILMTMLIIGFDPLSLKKAIICLIVWCFGDGVP